MKILRIRGRNLASLGGDFELDFTRRPLIGAGLFSIIGETGAGKSTILDALCLALYGQFPRLKMSGGSERIEILRGETIQTQDPRAILKTGATEALAEAEVLIGDARLLARWGVRRARNKPTGALQQAERSLIDTADDSVVASGKTRVEKEIEQRLGLNYDQFKRTALLAQNEFDAFLRADDSERAELLEKITGTRLYSRLSEAAFESARAAKARLEELKRQHELADLLSDEDRARLQQEIGQAGESSAARQKALEEVQAQLAFFERREELTKQRDEARAQLSQAEENLRQANDDVQLVEQLQRVLPLDGLFDKAAQASARQEELSTRKADLTAEQQQLTARLAQLQTELNERGKAEQTAKRALEKAEPDLKKAARLDIEIAQSDELLAEQRRQLTQAEEGLAQLSAQAQTHEQELQQLRQTAAQLDEKLLAATGREALAPRREKLAAAFEALGEVNGQLATAQKALAATGEHLAQQQTGEQVVRLEEQAAGQAVEQARQRASRQSELLATLQPDRSRKHSDDHAALLQALRALRLQALATRDAADRLQKLDEEMKEVKLAAREGEAALGETAHEIALLQARWEEAEDGFHSAEAVMSDHALRLRAELKPGEPCPVCGAREHPGHDDEIGARLLKQLAERRAELSSALTARQAEESEQRIRQEQARARAQELSRQHDETAATLAVLKAETASRRHEAQTAATQAERRVSLPGEPEASTDALSKLIETAESEQSQLRQKLQAIQQAEQEQQRCAEALSKAEAGLATARASSERLAEAAREAREQHAREEAQAIRLAEKRDLMLEALLADLSPFDLSRDDLLRDIKATARFVAGELAALATARVERQDTARRINVLEREAELAGERLKHRQTEYQQLSAAEQQLAASCRRRQEERQSLFAGEAVETVRARLQQALEAEQAAHRQTVLDDRETRTRQDGTARQLADLASKREAAANELRLHIERRDLALAEAGLQLDEAEQVLALSAPERDRVRQRVEVLRQARRDADTALQDRERQLQAHAQKQPQTEGDRVALMAEARQAREDIAALHQQLGRDRARLQQDDEARAARKKLHGRIEKAEAAYGDRELVSLAIGSQNGAKFRRFAQGVTLDHLVSLANVQLKVLNPRYEIERNPLSSGGLGLQMLDLELGGEVRPVQSLSGGERFLVSLALALALSRLDGRASFVDTLFIDEGFGALDARSLDMAVEALERLQSEGRRVGVISHVEALKERIGVQVMVEKQGDGRSRVRVAGADS